MKRRSKAGGKAEKAGRRKATTRKRRNAPDSESKVMRLSRELNDALEREIATSDVLKVISSSPADVNSVFEAILESAGRLCNSKLPAVFRFDGALLHIAATKNWPAEAMAALSSRFPMSPNPHLTTGRVVLTKSVVIQ
jgi:two-component system, NtrC family, sensor kinase